MPPSSPSRSSSPPPSAQDLKAKALDKVHERDTKAEYRKILDF